MDSEFESEVESLPEHVGHIQLERHPVSGRACAHLDGPMEMLAVTLLPLASEYEEI